MTKQIQLTKGKVALVDDEDYEQLNQHKWYFTGKYAARCKPFLVEKARHIFMHREIAKTPDGMYTDHINGNKLDNRRANLRICTNAENRHNLGRRADNCSSQYKGVSWYKNRRTPWGAHIGVNGKLFHIGTFNTPEEAARAYDAAAKVYFGEFARLNFPDP